MVYNFGWVFFGQILTNQPLWQTHQPNNVAITSATKPTIVGLQKQIMWLLHLPQWLITSAINNQLAITSANNIMVVNKKVTITSVTKNNKKVWHKFSNK